MKVRVQKGSYKDEEDNGKVDKYFFIETLYYGFWLRFCHEHFIPCEECQDKLDDIIMGKPRKEYPHWYTQWIFDSDVPIELSITEKAVTFKFNFVWIQSSGSNGYANSLHLCKSCVRKFVDGFKNTDELHIGSEVKPPVELWRKWDIDDMRTQRLDKILVKVKDNGIHLNSFYANLRNKKTTKAVDNYFDHLHKNLPYYPTKD